MAEDLKTKVTIGGDTTGLANAFADAAAKVRDGAASITGQFTQVGAVFESVTSKLVAFSAGLGAAAGFAEIIKSTLDLTTSVRDLSRAMGTSVEDASVLKSALTIIGATSEGYVGALDHLARQMKKNEEGINALGIATRNTDGTTRESQTVMQDALRTVQQYKPGLDQTQAAMYLFGRSVAEVRALMPLLNVNMDEAKAKAQALGLVLSDQQVAAVNRYKMALNESKEVVEGAFNAIGQKLVPVLTEAAKAFAELGPQIVRVASVVGDVLVEGFTIAGNVMHWFIDTAKEVWSVVVDGFHQIAEVFSGAGGTDSVVSWGEAWRNVLAIFSAVGAFIKGVFVVVLDELIGAVKATAQAFVAVGTSAADIAHGDFALAWKDMKAGFQSVRDTTVKTWDQMALDAGKAGENIGAALLSGYKKTTPKPGDTTDPFKFGSGTKGFEAPEKATDLAGRDAVLQAQLAGEVAIVKEYVREQDVELKRGYKDGLVSLQSYYTQRLALSQLELDTEISVAERMQTANAVRMKAAQEGGDDKKIQAALAEQIKLENELIILRQRRAAVTRESAAAETDAERALAQQIGDVKIAAYEKSATLALDSQKRLIEGEQRLGQISNEQALDAYKKLEDARYAIAVKAVRDRAALQAQTPLEAAKLGAELETLEADHQDKIAKIQLDAIKARADFEQKAIDTLQSGFANLFESISTGQKSITKSFEDFFNSIYSQMAKLASEDLAKRLFSSMGVGSGAAPGGGGLLALLGLGGGGSGLSAGQAGPPANLAGGGGLLSWLGLAQGGIAYVPHTGLAMLHSGERVLTRQENMAGDRGGSVTVHNHFDVPAETTYESRASIASQVGRSLQAARRHL